MNLNIEQRIEIREAKPSESEKLTKIAYAAKRYWGYPEAYIDLWGESLTFTPDRISSSIVQVAVSDQPVIGFYTVITPVADGVYEIYDLWVLPDFIGKGIGKQLTKHEAQMVLAQGGYELRLESDPNAVGFYKKMGMEKIGQSPSKPEGRMLDVMAVTLLLSDEGVKPPLE